MLDVFSLKIVNRSTREADRKQSRSELLDLLRLQARPENAPLAFVHMFGRVRLNRQPAAGIGVALRNLVRKSLSIVDYNIENRRNFDL